MTDDTVCPCQRAKGSSSRPMVARLVRYGPVSDKRQTFSSPLTSRSNRRIFEPWAGPVATEVAVYMYFDPLSTRTAIAAWLHAIKANQRCH